MLICVLGPGDIAIEIIKGFADTEYGVLSAGLTVENVIGIDGFLITGHVVNDDFDEVAVGVVFAIGDLIVNGINSVNYMLVIIDGGNAGRAIQVDNGFDTPTESVVLELCE